MDKFKTYLAAVLSSFFFGIAFVWTKQAFVDFGPITTIFLRLVISIIVIYILLSILKSHQKVEKKDYPLFLLGGILSPFIFFITEYEGLTLVTATVGSVIIATLPLFTPIAAYFFLRERFSPKFLIGLVISCVGVFITLTTDNFRFNSDIFGIILESLTVVAGVFYSLVQRKLTQKYNAMTIVLYQNIIGCILFIPFLFWWEWGKIIHTVPSFTAIKAVILLAIFASSGAFILFTYSIKKLGPSRANLFFNLMPMFTAFSSFFFLDEKFSLHKIIGICIVLLGLYLSQLTTQQFRKSKK
ncbi:MAG: DMT family transporter [Hyphomicrobiales bacterium]